MVEQNVSNNTNEVVSTWYIKIKVKLSVSV